MTTNFLELPEPRTLQDTGIGGDQIEQLLVKTLYAGEATGLEIADRMCLPFTLFEPLLERLRNERLMEVKGTTGSGAASYRYALTDGGRERARQYFEVSHYVGAVPISLARYVAYMTALQAARGYMDKERLRNGFSHLIISDEVLEMVGPAVNAGKAVFLYGPPGNGKSVIAEGMGRSLGGDMHIPRAIDVDGHTVMMYDPIVHESLEDPRESSIVVAAAAHDRRWVRIRRPVVMVGGELTLDMLDLRFNPTARFYEAPIQLKANGGVFLVDDFGRQRMRPQDLLNRWIVPLESRIDHLTLHSGKKFVVPFDTLVVFATNLPPESLADEAFLRRIPYKIAIEDPNLDTFTKIFELNCKRRNMRFHQVMVAYLQRRHYKPSGRPLRACHPRDLLDQVSALCRYRGIEPAITRELLDAACKSYFVGEAPVPQLPVTPKASARRMDVH
jgi:MoxR-like ATPase